MRIVFDSDFDQGCWPGPLRGHLASAGEDWVGPSRFVQILETALGLGGPSFTLPSASTGLVPAIRVTEGLPRSASAEVDPFATARRLLQWRDTLAMCGWRGAGKAPRLAALAALMATCAPACPPSTGDRRRSRAAFTGPGIDRTAVPRADLEPLWQLMRWARWSNAARVWSRRRPWHRRCGRDKTSRAHAKTGLRRRGTVHFGSCALRVRWRLPKTSRLGSRPSDWQG